MSDPRTTEALVLRTVEYGDRDQVVTLFGRDTGKFSAIAKNARGSKRRFGGGLQPMRLLEAHYNQKPNRDLAMLREIEVVDDFAAIQSDYDKIAAGSYATDLLRNITVEADPAPALFEFIVRWFERLAEANPASGIVEVLVRHLQFRLLELLGSMPALQQCFRCGRGIDQMDKIRALRSGEGVVCGACRRTGEPIGLLYPGTITVCRYLQRPDADAPEALEEPRPLAQAGRLIEAAIRRLLDQPLKSRAMLDSVLDTDT